ncbi:MAG: hypothetical protein AB2417_02680 [Clostridiaceae bacterium]
MIKILAILFGLLSLSFGVILWACIYVSGQASRTEEERWKIERPDFIRMEAYK